MASKWVVTDFVSGMGMLTPDIPVKSRGSLIDILGSPCVFLCFRLPVDLVAPNFTLDIVNLVMDICSLFAKITPSGNVHHY